MLASSSSGLWRYATCATTLTISGEVKPHTMHSLSGASFTTLMQEVIASNLAEPFTTMVLPHTSISKSP